MRLASAVLITVASSLGLANCQTTASAPSLDRTLITDVLDQLNPLNANSKGLHLYDVTVSSAFYSSTYAVAFVGPSHTSDHPILLSVSGDIGWLKVGQRTRISVMYVPSYTRGFYLAHYHLFDQVLSVGASRRMGSKWSLGGSVSGMTANYGELLFAPIRYGSLPGSVSASQDAPITLPIEQPGIISSPETAYVYGARELSAAAGLTLSYSYSPRSTLSLSLHGMRTQYLKEDSATTVRTYSIPRTTSVHASLNWSYSLSPRTVMTLDAASARVFTTIQDAYVNHERVWLKRALSPQWYVQAMGGVGNVMPIRQKFKVNTRAQSEWGAGAGYSIDDSTFAVQFTHSVADIYGLGADAMETMAGNWGWKPRSRSISLSSAFGYSRLVGPRFPNSGSWTARIGLTKRLDEHTSIGVSYAYARFPKTLLLSGFSRSRSGLIAELSWAPSGHK